MVQLNKEVIFQSTQRREPVKSFKYTLEPLWIGQELAMKAPLCLRIHLTGWLAPKLESFIINGLSVQINWKGANFEPALLFFSIVIPIFPKGKFKCF